MFSLPSTVVVNSIRLNIVTVNTAGTLDISVYSEDGQTRLISVTTASISGTGVVTTAGGGVSLPAGNYYIAVNTNSTADIAFSTNTITATLRTGVTSEPTLSGTVTITAGTPPTTITQVSVTDGG